MAEVDTKPPALPDYVLDSNAVLKDEASWRYGQAPDYSKTRKVYEETKTQHHEPASLPDLVSNLVKNWEIEASFKTSLSQWRTIDHANYTFSINGSPPQTGEHMLGVGTYNAIINSPNEYYDPKKSGLEGSHKTFKRMMPTFAWEVLEVYAGPPRVVFKWRHWGKMTGDYVGINGKGEKVTVKAHGGPIDIQGVTVAQVNEGLQVQSLETWFDPMEMFRQIAKDGILEKEVRDPVVGETVTSGLDNVSAGSVSERQGELNESRNPTESVVEPANIMETGISHEEISKSVAPGCPFLMKQETAEVTAKADEPSE